LYSLCGKAWTTINAVIEESAIANPLALLIQELNAFCEYLPSNSLVVASSDVMLDITFANSGPREFPQHGVSVVSVMESPHIAKNHGVLVLDRDFLGSFSHESFIVGPALNYLQVIIQIIFSSRNF
jgi:hypothetical protein